MSTSHDLFTAKNSPKELPVRTPETGSRFDRGNNPEPGTALCLSGGGYRAMLFHVGTLWRLYEAGILKDLKRVSSVSGGSITAAMLGLKWDRLTHRAGTARQELVPHVVAPLRELASRTIDANSVIGGILLPGTIAEKVAAKLDRLYEGATLQHLPDEARAPRFVINATSVQSGALWRFSRREMRDYRVGRVERPAVRLGTAVAASAAFPPVLSPLELELDAQQVLADEKSDLHGKPFTERAVLTDGGVYDNLGLETIWKRYDTILVSDAGGKMDPEPEPKEDWARHSYRVLSLIDNQVRNLRKRQVIDSFQEGRRKGAYWGIRTDIANYRLADPLPAPFKRTTELAQIATRLKRLDDSVQERLINWGYAVCDAALRRHLGVQDRGELPYDRPI